MLPQFGVVTLESCIAALRRRKPCSRYAKLGSPGALKLGVGVEDEPNPVSLESFSRVIDWPSMKRNQKPSTLPGPSVMGVLKDTVASTLLPVTVTEFTTCTHEGSAMLPVGELGARTFWPAPVTSVPSRRN
jgi:hypothetical protein